MTLAGWGALYVMSEGFPTFIPALEDFSPRGRLQDSSTAENSDKQRVKHRSLLQLQSDSHAVRPARLSKQSTDCDVIFRDES